MWEDNQKNEKTLSHKQLCERRNRARNENAEKSEYSKSSELHEVSQNNIKSTNLFPDVSRFERNLEEFIHKKLSLNLHCKAEHNVINLPAIVDGKNIASVNHDVHEINVFYLEMLDKLRLLKKKFGSRNYFENGDCDETRCNESLITLERRKHEPSIRKLLQNIAKLDEQISDNEKVWKLEKGERHKVQEDMCTVITESDNYLSQKWQFQMFLDLCKFETSAVAVKENDTGENTKEAKTKVTKDLKQSQEGEKNFIKRNIELAKQRTMTTMSLTDEEKLKLQVLLSDIDLEEYSGDKQNTKTITANEVEVEHKNETTISAQNSFKFDIDEENTMLELNKKLQELVKLPEYCDKNLPNENIEDDLEDISNEEKPWKHYLLQEKLQNIDKKLGEIAAADENSKTTKENE